MKISFCPGVTGTKLPAAAHFLEHALLPGRPTEVIVGDGDGRVHISRDAGASFVSVTNRFQRSVSKCFTLRSGSRLVRLKDSAETALCDMDLELLAVLPFKSAEWHGSWSIAESLLGVVMFCEYVERADVVRVWRSGDGGASWSVALQATSLASEPADTAEVRHFHTCTWIGETRWVVSSGDEARHCRMWLSDDDGLTWAELSDWQISGADVQQRYQKSILRHTAEVWDGDVAYWVTDDLLHRGRAAFVRADISKRQLEILADLGGNEMRTLVRHGDRLVAISEVKHDLRHADVYVLSRQGEILYELKIANVRAQKLSFTRSRSSGETVDGTFFTFDDGLLSEKCRFVRWQIRD